MTRLGSPPERCHRVEAVEVEVSQFAIAFASRIASDTGVFIIIIVRAGCANDLSCLTCVALCSVAQARSDSGSLAAALEAPFAPVGESRSSLACSPVALSSVGAH